MRTDINDFSLAIGKKIVTLQAIRPLLTTKIVEETR